MLNKKAVYIIVSVTVVTLIAAVASFLIFATKEPIATRAPYLFSKEEMSQIKSGDIILRHGYGAVSLLVEQVAGNHRVSHCGMLLKEGTTLSVIHAISSNYAQKDGVQTCPFQEFSSDARPNSLVVLRPKVANPDTLIAVAQHYVTENAPFDLQFSMETKDEIYCTELFYYIFKEAANIELYDAQNPDHSFAFFFDTTLFQMVIDHRKNDTISL